MSTRLESVLLPNVGNPRITLLKGREPSFVTADQEGCKQRNAQECRNNLPNNKQFISLRTRRNNESARFLSGLLSSPFLSFPPLQNA